MPQIKKQDVRLFSLSSNEELANEIAKCVNIPLSKISISRFADGEINLDIKETVRGYHCFVIQTTSEPVNEHYMELFIMIDALKRASAKSINIIMPYYGYSRQDRKTTARQPITSKLIADLLTKAGATRIFAMDLHASEIQGFFNIPIDNLTAMPVFLSYMKKHFANEDMVIVSPDHGGATRARMFADNFSHAPIAIIDKRRPEPNVAEAVSIIGDVKNKDAVIIDDIIDTAGSAVAAARALKSAGANKIYMFATHALLSGNAIQKIEESPIEQLIISNSVKLSKNKNSKKIVQLSIADVFGQGILDVLNDKPISQTFYSSIDIEK